MRREAMAERVLAMFVGRVRAAAVMGDLAEERTSRGARWFWWSYVDILMAAAWRPLLAFAVVAAASWFGGRYLVGGYGLSWPTWTDKSDFLNVAAMVGNFSAFVFVFSAVRYGLSDRLTRLALGFAVTGQVAGWFFFVNGMLAMAAAAYALLCGVALFSAEGRRTLAAIAGLCVAFLFVERAALWMYLWVRHHEALSFWNSTTVEAWWIVCYFGALAVCAVLCAMAHQMAIGERDVARE